jgi:diacylglycerol kinase
MAREDQTAPDKRDNSNDKSGKLGWRQVLSSVVAAGLGVQSRRNRERDFRQGRFAVFVAAGIVFTLLFIAAVFTVVQLVLKSAGH